MLTNEEALEAPLILAGQNGNEKNIKFLSLNLFLRPPLVKNNESDHKDARATFFCEHFLGDYDVICLQEVFSTLNSRRSEIIDRASSKGFHYHAISPSPGFFKPQMIDGGLLILSRFPIIDSDFFGFGNGLYPDIFSYKGVLYAKLSINYHTLHIFTLHLQASYPTDSPETRNLYAEARKEQILSSAKFIQSKLTNLGDPYVFAGDFNIDGNSLEYQTIQEALENINPHDILREKYGKAPLTYGIKLASGEPEETVLSHKDENTNELSIDYIFISKTDTFKAIMAETKVQPFYVSNQPFTRISDHYGVQSTFSF